MPYFLPYLSVSTQAIQASQSLCSINDWAVDGVDNDTNGVVDDPWTSPNPTQTTPTEPQYEQSSPQDNANRTNLANRLYIGLGLSTWAHAGPAAVTPIRVQQAAQLVANIIDFRDATDVPTKLTNTDLKETGATIPAFTVYGAKGLHVTQVMPTPDAIYSTTGTEMVNDGQTVYPAAPVGGYLTDGKDWDWIPAQNCWQIGYIPDANPVATFTFGGLKPGFYSMRLIGTPGTTFNVIYPPTTGNTYYAIMGNPDPEVPATWSTGFVRNFVPTTLPPNNPLGCFQVAADGTLSFQLQVPAGVGTPQFRGFALCAQYIQLTNISTHDIQLCDNVGNSFMNVTTDQGVVPWQPSGNYIQVATASRPVPVGTNPVDLRKIPGAAVGKLAYLAGSLTPVSATFPINYGTYVICMSEESYERQWAARANDPDYNGATNGDGLWGDAWNEPYTIYPFGDLSDDAHTLALLMGVKKGQAADYTPSVAVTDVVGNLIAGGNVALGYVDGAIRTIPADAGGSAHSFCYSSIEKTVLLQPTWDNGTTYWFPCWEPADGTGVPAFLAAYQNVLATIPQDVPRIPVSTMFRTCMNRNYNPPTDTPAAPPTYPPAVGTTTYPQMIWSAAPIPVSVTDVTKLSVNPTLIAPSLLVTQTGIPPVAQNRVFPIILNRPYPTTGWLGPGSNLQHGCHQLGRQRV